MNVLIIVASKHGATTEIAEAIVRSFADLGHDASLADASGTFDLSGSDAVILGSAVYMGNWLVEAKSLVETHGPQLRTMPVWLFSSGPLGADELKPAGDPAIVPEMMEKTGARGHRVFAGKLDKSALGFGERMITRMVGAPEGDFRDWDDVRSWVLEIDRELASTHGVATD